MQHYFNNNKLVSVTVSYFNPCLIFVSNSGLLKATNHSPLLALFTNIRFGYKGRIWTKNSICVIAGTFSPVETSSSRFDADDGLSQDEPSQEHLKRQQTVSGDSSTDGALDSYINFKSLTKNIKIWILHSTLSLITQGQML